MTAPVPPGDERFREQLPTAVEQWQREGLLRPYQAQVLLARYGLLGGENAVTLRRFRLVWVLAALGALLVGVGVILLVGANWEQIPKWARLVALLVAIAASYRGGYRLAYGGRYPLAGRGLLLLGSLLWGAGIFLVAQTYHWSGDGEPTSPLLWWFAGVLPLAYVLSSRPHLALALSAGMVWLGITLGRLATPVEGPLAGAMLLVGVTLYAVGHLHGERGAVGRLGPVYEWFGLPLVLGGLYVMSYRDLWAWREALAHSPWPWLTALLAPAVVAALALAVQQGRRDRSSLAEAAGLLVLVGLGVLIVALPAPVHVRTYQPGAGLPGAIIFNAALLLAELGLIALGWVRNRPALANLGLAVFFVQVVTRYFDLLGGMLSSGFTFIGAGLLLVGGGLLLERSRRRLVGAMAQRRAT